MSTTRQLKKILNDTRIENQQKMRIYDLSNPENNFLIVLKKRGLIDYIRVYLNNKHIGATHCSITKESRQKFIVQTLTSALASIITGVIVTLILVYVFHISK
ncbi:hypothetical protein HMPREF5045_00402 [Lactobacillus crispatus 125-2-CHN]|nr:hypothetical protein HMPREF5045_00402 [Lactobacillus crispatus 125-2-CHN]